MVRRSRDLALFAAIDLSAGGVEGLQEALEAKPDAAVAVWAKGPLEAARLAERLLEHAGPAILHPAPARAPLGDGVQVTHGWLTLSGISALERLFASPSERPESVRLRVRGLPEGPGTGLAPALYQALTVVHRFGRQIRVTRALLDDEQHIAVSLDVDAVPWRVEVAARKGPELHLAVRTATGDYVYRADAVSESLERSSAEPRAIPAAPWAERCLRQIASPAAGGDLSDARATRALVDAVELALERRLPPTPFARGLREATAAIVPEMSGSFRIPAGHELDALESDALARIGLEGDVPDAPPLRPTPPPELPLPPEVIAYQLELRPAVMVSASRQDAERIATQLPGVVLRRVREATATTPGPFGERGEPWIELYAARDGDTAHRLAALAEGDAMELASSLGAVLGYPACCVQGFVAQLDATDESENRYAVAARTAFGPGLWPALLDDTSLGILPHVPCTYRCERSREQATALLDALADEDPPLSDALVGYLGGPVLYFDREHQNPLPRHGQRGRHRLPERRPPLAQHHGLRSVGRSHRPRRPDRARRRSADGVRRRHEAADDGADRSRARDRPALRRDAGGRRRQVAAGTGHRAVEATRSRAADHAAARDGDRPRVRRAARRETPVLTSCRGCRGCRASRGCRGCRASHGCRGCRASRGYRGCRASHGCRGCRDCSAAREARVLRPATAPPYRRSPARGRRSHAGRRPTRPPPFG